MEESTLRWPTDKEREEREEVCSIGEVPHVTYLNFALCSALTIQVSLSYMRQLLRQVAFTFPFNITNITILHCVVDG